MDSGNANDLYGVFFMENGEPQETDTHWRCYNGGGWNWRLKFPITLPMKPTSTIACAVMGPRCC